MHTRSMCGVRLERDHHVAPYGVLCVESAKPRGITARTLGCIMESIHFQILQDVLDLSLKEIPGEVAWKGLKESAG